MQQQSLENKKNKITKEIKKKNGKKLTSEKAGRTAMDAAANAVALQYDLVSFYGIVGSVTD